MANWKCEPAAGGGYVLRDGSNSAHLTEPEVRAMAGGKLHEVQQILSRNADVKRHWGGALDMATIDAIWRAVIDTAGLL